MATLTGTTGNDTILGTNPPASGQNTAASGDVIFGGAGNDTITGGTGGDVIFGGEGDDTVKGGDGNDWISGGTGDDMLFGGNGNDYIEGNSGDDIISDGNGNDVVEGGTGNDWVIAGQGDDQFSGGKGFDTIDFSNANNGMFIDMSKGTAVGLGVDTFDGFEAVIGSAYADDIKGTSEADVIFGGGGDDMIRGLAGSDTLTGGRGHDTFKFMVKDVMVGGVHQGVDTITDFTSIDKIDLFDFFKGRVADIDSVVHVRDTAEGNMVSVKMGEAFVDVVLMHGFHGGTASQLASDQMILA